MESLQIIDRDNFERAREIMTARTTHHSEVPLNSKGKSLLVGNVFCGHCGNRLTLTTSGRNRVHADGTIYHDVRMRYQCHYKVRHPGDCDGQSGYGVKKLDGLVDKIVRLKFAQVKSVSEEELIGAQQNRKIELATTRCEQLDAIRKEKESDLADLKAETIKVIRGKSKLSEDLLNELIGEATAALEAAKIDRL